MAQRTKTNDCRLGGSQLALRAILVGTLLVGALVGCGDPVHDNAVAALGPEAPGVPKGPLHRPGQPCVLCHGPQGSATTFLLAGTVYISADSRMPIENVTVNVTDSASHKATATSNCAGNFFVTPAGFTPDAPLWVTLGQGDVFRQMDTAIYREGSCAACHHDPKGPAAVGHVFLIDDPLTEKVPVSQCH